jgi:hypothetical protein
VEIRELRELRTLASTRVRGRRREKKLCPRKRNSVAIVLCTHPQDARRGIGRPIAAFWTAVGAHYARHKLVGCLERPARSLETKWGDIKQATNKFIGVHGSIVALNESGKTDDDRIQDAMELFRTKVGKPFLFKHCWFILQTYPRFTAIFKPMLKRKATLAYCNNLPLDQND